MHVSTRAAHNSIVIVLSDLEYAIQYIAILQIDKLVATVGKSTASGKPPLSLCVLQYTTAPHTVETRAEFHFGKLEKPLTNLYVNLP